MERRLVDFEAVLQTDVDTLIDWVVEEGEPVHLDDLDGLGGMMVMRPRHSPLAVGCLMVPGLEMFRLGHWCWRRVVALELLMATGPAREMVPAPLGGWARWMAMHQRFFLVDFVAPVV